MTTAAVDCSGTPWSAARRWRSPRRAASTRLHVGRDRGTRRIPTNTAYRALPVSLIPSESDDGCAPRAPRPIAPRSRAKVRFAVLVLRLQRFDAVGRLRSDRDDLKRNDV